MSRVVRAAFVVVVLVGQSASAGFSSPVIAAFKGQMIISTDMLPSGKTDHETIAKIKAANVKELTGEKAGDVEQWHFHYAAFLTKTGASAITIEFVDDGKLAADKHLEGFDPKGNVLVGELTVDEDEGLSPGKTYSVEVSDGDTPLAKTVVTFR
jgi:hypothetical protein